MTGTILLIILATGVGIYHDVNKPTEYELNMEDGTNEFLVLQKNNQYACPIYCEIDHIHHAVLYNNDKEKADNIYVYHISKENESGTSLYCSNSKILSMSKLISKSPRDKLPDVLNASSKE